MLRGQAEQPFEIDPHACDEMLTSVLADAPTHVQFAIAVVQVDECSA